MEFLPRGVIKEFDLVKGNKSHSLDKKEAIGLQGNKQLEGTVNAGLVNSARSMRQLSQSVTDCVMPLLTREFLATMAKPTEGNTRSEMYFTNVRVQDNDLPIVIRKGSPEYSELMIKRQSAQNIIEENGFKHLIVPKSTLTDNNFLIEERLPLLKNGFPSSLAFYERNHEIFNEAALEFAIFLSKVPLGDIVGGNKDYLSNALWDKGSPRYDNVLIYAGDDGKGKIGLIDLDYLGTKRKEPDFIEGVLNAVTFFPHQYEVIIEAFKDKIVFSDNDMRRFEAKRDEGINALKIVVNDHCKYLEENNISMHTSQVSNKINSLDHEKVCNRFIDDLTNYYKQNYPSIYGRRFGRTEQAVLKSIEILKEKIFPRVLHFVEYLVEENLKNAGQLSEYELLAKRRIVFNASDEVITDKYYEYLEKTGVDFKNFSEFEEKMELIEPYGLYYTFPKILIDEGVFLEGKMYCKEDTKSIAVLF